MRFSNFERKISYKLSARKRARAVFIFWAVLALLLFFTFTAINRLEPVAVSVAMANVTDVITVEINDIIAEKILDGSIQYDNLVYFEKDGDGNIIALITNMQGINALQAEITKTITENLSDTSEISVTVPLGNIIGGAILSGKGPYIPIKIISLSNVTTKFRNEFSSAGINQTRHQIMLDIDVSIGILLAGYSDYWDSVHTEIVVAETVIVGNVPYAYANYE